MSKYADGVTLINGGSKPTFSSFLLKNFAKKKEKEREEKKKKKKKEKKKVFPQEI